MRQLCVRIIIIFVMRLVHIVVYGGSSSDVCSSLSLCSCARFSKIQTSKFLVFFLPFFLSLAFPFNEEVYSCDRNPAKVLFRASFLVHSRLPVFQQICITKMYPIFDSFDLITRKPKTSKQRSSGMSFRL